MLLRIFAADIVAAQQHQSDIGRIASQPAWQLRCHLHARPTPMPFMIAVEGVALVVGPVGIAFEATLERTDEINFGSGINE